MEWVTNNLVILLIGTFAVLIAASQLKVVKRKLGAELIGNILASALFTALSVPFLWACLALLGRLHQNTENWYVMTLVMVAFFLFLRGEQEKTKVRKRIKASQCRKTGRAIYREVSYSELFEIIRSQDPETEGKVLLVKTPQDLMELSISGSVCISQEEIMNYVRRHFGIEFIALIHEPSQDRILFISA